MAIFVTQYNLMGYITNHMKYTHTHIYIYNMCVCVKLGYAIHFMAMKKGVKFDEHPDGFQTKDVNL
jgi:hypothetical protein